MSVSKPQKHDFSLKATYVIEPKGGPRRFNVRLSSKQIIGSRLGIPSDRHRTNGRPWCTITQKIYLRQVQGAEVHTGLWQMNIGFFAKTIK
jgi:hypothetical protein